MKYKIILVDKDEVYTTRFKNYVCNNYNNIDITVFNNIMEFRKFYKTVKNVSVLIISESIANKIKIKNKIILTENDFVDDYEENKIFKYQSIGKIINILLNKLKNTESISICRNVKTKLISIYSPLGGVGKTEETIRLANRLSKNKKVLYINFEIISSISEFLNLDSGISLISVIYNMDTIMKKGLDSFVFAINDGFHTFRRCENPIEFFDIKIETIRKFIDVIKKLDYDYIFLDSDSKFDETTLCFFDESDKIILFTSNNKRKKVESIYETLNSKREYRKIEEKIFEYKPDNNSQRGIEKLKKIIE